jgi:hypothetical protein
MRKTVLPLIAILSMILIGCVEPEEAERPERRGKLGKADHVAGTCNEAGACGGKSSGTCWCDDLCSQYGDCCSDAAEVCLVDECEADGSGCHDGMVCNQSSPNNCVDDPCAPQDAAGQGSCEAFFGYAWDGTGCVGISGCSCSGSDCGNLTFDQAACEQAHNLCNDTVEPEQCDGFAGLQCSDPDTYCFHADNCGQADMLGTCVFRPDACTQQYDPVCGCDGTTYGNSCMAAAAGINVLHDGACDVPQPEPDSCEDSCGGQAPAGCWCDSACSYYGDCCGDYGAQCS